MTKRNQRIAIWIITIILTVGTLGTFLLVALEYKNYSDQTSAYQKYLAEEKETAQKTADESEALSGYSAEKFTASDVTSLKIEVLTAGTGSTLKKTDKIQVSYFGWLPSGEIFESTKKKNKADSPTDFTISSTIKGWQKGLTGQKVGSVVKLTIPSDQAYSSAGSGIIPADTPIAFIIKIDKVE